MSTAGKPTQREHVPGTPQAMPPKPATKDVPIARPFAPPPGYTPPLPAPEVPTAPASEPHDARLAPAVSLALGLVALVLLGVGLPWQRNVAPRKATLLDPVPSAAWPFVQPQPFEEPVPENEEEQAKSEPALPPPPVPVPAPPTKPPPPPELTPAPLVAEVQRANRLDADPRPGGADRPKWRIMALSMHRSVRDEALHRRVQRAGQPPNVSCFLLVSLRFDSQALAATKNLSEEFEVVGPQGNRVGGGALVYPNSRDRWSVTLVVFSEQGWRNLRELMNHDLVALGLRETLAGPKPIPLAKSLDDRPLTEVRWYPIETDKERHERLGALMMRAVAELAEENDLPRAIRLCEMLIHRHPGTRPAKEARRLLTQWGE